MVCFFLFIIFFFSFFIESIIETWRCTHFIGLGKYHKIWSVFWRSCKNIFYTMRWLHRLLIALSASGTTFQRRCFSSCLMCSLLSQTYTSTSPSCHPSLPIIPTYSHRARTHRRHGLSGSSHILQKKKCLYREFKTLWKLCQSISLWTRSISIFIHKNLFGLILVKKIAFLQHFFSNCRSLKGCENISTTSRMYLNVTWLLRIKNSLQMTTHILQCFVWERNAKYLHAFTSLCM